MSYILLDILSSFIAYIVSILLFFTSSSILSNSGPWLPVFAHYTNQKDPEKTEEFTRALQEYTINHEQVITLPEEYTIFINGDEIQVIGNKDYYRFRIGARSTIQVPEEKCTLRK